MLIYVAGPLFSEAEKAFNLRLAERLEQANFEVFLPQRDGVERNQPPYDRMSADERRRAMFELDKEKIFECDIFLFVLDGRVPDEDACVELGLAHAHKELLGAKKLLVGLHTDSRAAFLGSKLNPMLRVPLEPVVGLSGTRRPRSWSTPSKRLGENFRGLALPYSKNPSGCLPGGTCA